MSLEKIKDQMHSGQIYFPNDEGADKRAEAVYGKDV